MLYKWLGGDLSVGRLLRVLLSRVRRSLLAKQDRTQEYPPCAGYYEGKNMQVGTSMGEMHVDRSILAGYTDIVPPSKPHRARPQPFDLFKTSAKGNPRHYRAGSRLPTKRQL